MSTHLAETEVALIEPAVVTNPTDVTAEPRTRPVDGDRRARGRTPKSRLLLILIGAMSMFMSSCGCVPDWAHGDGVLYGIHNEDLTRVNVVIYRGATEALIAINNAQGIRGVRNTLVQAVPGGGITLWCWPGPTPRGCVRMGDVRDWFRSDVRNRSDLAEALGDARRNRDCLAWTFLPSRNFTHKRHSCKGI